MHRGYGLLTGSLCLSLCCNHLLDMYIHRLNHIRQLYLWKCWNLSEKKTIEYKIILRAITFVFDNPRRSLFSIMQISVNIGNLMTSQGSTSPIRLQLHILDSPHAAISGIRHRDVNANRPPEVPPKRHQNKRGTKLKHTNTYAWQPT